MTTEGTTTNTRLASCEAPLTPPYALGENTKRGDWDDLGEHHARQKVQAASQWN